MAVIESSISLSLFLSYSSLPNPETPPLTHRDTLPENPHTSYFASFGYVPIANVIKEAEIIIDQWRIFCLVFSPDISWRANALGVGEIGIKYEDGPQGKSSFTDE